MEEQKLYKLKEVETALKTTRRTIYRWITEGKLEAIKVGGNWRVTQEALDKFLSARK